METVVSNMADDIKGKSNLVKQFVVTPAAGKRLIAKGLLLHPAMQNALKTGTVVIIAGTTNGYLAEEILAASGSDTGFSRQRFFRGIVQPPKHAATGAGRLPKESEMLGDVVLKQGGWEKGKTIFDVVDDLREGDIIVKGANALDVSQKRAAILVTHPKAGTMGAAMQAVIGRRVQLILPVGLEKRVEGNLDELAALLNASEAQGARLWPLQGLVFTEIDAIRLLSGAEAYLVAAGGVSGAEGSVRLAVRGTTEQVDQAESVLHSTGSEPPFEY
jgi:hypothetical protein